MKQYEAMFLFDPTFASSFEKCESEIHRLMERAGAELIICRKWDERRLAFRINGRKRGVYVLTYFKAPPEGAASLEHDAKLAENILRLLVLRADDLTREDMDAAVGDPHAEPAKPDRPAPPPPATPPPATTETKDAPPEGARDSVETPTPVEGETAIADAAERPAATD